MLERIIHLSIRQRWFVMAIVLGLSVLGVWSFQRLPIDAVPDITNVQVQINTEAPGYSPLESEQRITFPIETAIADLKTALEGDDPEAIQQKTNTLAQASMKLGEAIYKSQAESEAATAKPDAGPSSPADDDVVDADFEDLGEDKKNS